MPMKVSTIVIEDNFKIKIKNLSVDSMQITKEGLELEFRGKDNKHTGDLIIRPGKLIWNKGQTSVSGKSISCTELFKLLAQKGRTASN